ncbi:Ubiquitin carboxyl-terminal hydrolase 16 [Lecanosticta acicola]|uniref:Ubiquitin carboxyl-terminal hydrolase n=1 Tax=Lecanosticta acicola TaxID=111012 RepID=A0AAI8YVA1_9PEZI|nr:Ubiquitin carboxyl-terminal hydrolase 16 [Lecanosticta acicola]
MPDRPLTIATYAAGASLAAITLVYVFGPTFFFDDDAANSSKSSRKKGVVGLVNPANDCFINSVLQALAGLPDLRAYLIREVHRRKLDGQELYSDLSTAAEERRKSASSKQAPEWKTLGLQQGLVTLGLKEVLDALNERPLHKKTISAQGFIRCVETAFKTRISRTQQDAQEFLQVIVERLAEEYYAGRRVRKRARERGIGRVVRTGPGDLHESSEGQAHDRPRDSKVMSLHSEPEESTAPEQAVGDEGDPEKHENVFPLEGKLESQVQCFHCNFKPKPSVSSFLSLTLNVPHDTTSSTLNQCLDQLLKIEHIEDFKCDRCRLEHALQVNSRQMSQARSKEERAALESDRVKIEHALKEDPEEPPKDVKLPDISTAPRRKISRYTRISSFPQVLAIHLSRSVWDGSSSSFKNTAKVSFPETLPLGGLLDRKTYRLLGVVTHKGGHNSGHYESLRRQVLNPPFSTPTSLGTEGVYSIKNTPTPSPRMSAVPSPQLSAIKEQERMDDGGSSPSLSTDSTHILSTPTSATPSMSSGSSTLQPPSSASPLDRRKHQPPIESVPAPGLPTPPHSASNSPHAEKPRRQSSLSGLRSRHGSRRKHAVNDRWWRISDDKVKESKTSDVMGMQKEVYMLFYEMLPGETSS